MSSAQRKPWTRDELILAINLYCKTPFGKIHVRNPEIISLAKRLDRTPGSISYKLANFASIDPSLSRKGASNVGKLDREVWEDFFGNWDEMAYQSEKAFSLEKINSNELGDNDITIPEGETRESVVRMRVNQSFFRKTILASYEACCITGIPNPELLIASHIIPWSRDIKNRTNPQNGLCLNCLHDKAFDVGLITISENFSVVLSPQIKNRNNEGLNLIKAYDGQQIHMPKRFIPNQEFLAYHRNHIFRAS